MKAVAGAASANATSLGVKGSLLRNMGDLDVAGRGRDLLLWDERLRQLMRQLRDDA
jgi:hypothetical protein